MIRYRTYTVPINGPLSHWKFFLWPLIISTWVPLVYELKLQFGLVDFVYFISSIALWSVQGLIEGHGSESKSSINFSYWCLSVTGFLRICRAAERVKHFLIHYYYKQLTSLINFFLNWKKVYMYTSDFMGRITPMRELKMISRCWSVRNKQHLFMYGDTS